MKSRTKQKSVSLSLRLPPDEAATLKKLAAAEGVSVSELIRKKALSDTGFVSSKKQQEYFAERMMAAAEFQKVKEAVQEHGYQINLESLERSIYQSWL